MSILGPLPFVIYGKDLPEGVIDVVPVNVSRRCRVNDECKNREGLQNVTGRPCETPGAGKQMVARVQSQLKQRHDDGVRIKETRRHQHHKRNITAEIGNSKRFGNGYNSSRVTGHGQHCSISTRLHVITTRARNKRASGVNLPHSTNKRARGLEATDSCYNACL